MKILKQIFVLLSLLACALAVPQSAIADDIDFLLEIYELEDVLHELANPGTLYSCCCKVNGQCTGVIKDVTSDVSGSTCDLGSGSGTWDCWEQTTTRTHRDIKQSPFNKLR